MTSPKFKVGQTVMILSRQLDSSKSWENNFIGNQAVIDKMRNNTDRNDGYEGEIVYGLLILDDWGKPIRRLCWYEERYLELYCSNEERGVKILANA